MVITETQLIHIDAFTQALAEAKTILEVKELADKASLFRQLDEIKRLEGENG